MKNNDYYLYIAQDGMIAGYNLTLAQAKRLKAEITADCPEEAHLVSICRVSDDYKLAAERAFSHLANW